MGQQVVQVPVSALAIRDSMLNSGSGCLSGPIEATGALGRDLDQAALRARLEACGAAP